MFLVISVFIFLFVYVFIYLLVYSFTYFYTFLSQYVFLVVVPPPSFCVGRGWGLANGKGDEEWEEGSSVIGLPLSFKVVSHREKEDTEE